MERLYAAPLRYGGREGGREGGEEGVLTWKGCVSPLTVRRGGREGGRGGERGGGREGGK